MKNEKLNKSRLNAEEDYITTPISVLRYISDLEAEVKQLSIAGVGGAKGDQLVCPNKDCENPYPHRHTDGSHSCEDCGEVWGN